MQLPDQRARSLSLTRRRFVLSTGAAVAAGSVTLAGCSSKNANKATATATAARAAVTGATAAPAGATAPSATRAAAAESPTAGGAAVPQASPAAALKRGGMIKQGFAGKTPNWNPYLFSANMGQHWSAITNTLLTFDPVKTVIAPSLIDKWEVIQPGLEYVLHVRSGVSWHNKAPVNGRALTAEDVAYTIKVGSALQDPSVAAQTIRSSSYAGLQSVEVAGPDTVRIKLSKPNATILSAMGQWQQVVLPVEMPGKLSFDAPASFPGTGAFVCTEYNDGVSAKYVANKQYWEQGYPLLDGANYTFYGDRASYVAAALAGDVDALSFVSGDAERKPLSGNSSIKLYDYPSSTLTYIMFNSQRPGLTDPRVWKAFQLAFDYQGINDAVGGKGLWYYTGPLFSYYSQATQKDAIAKLPGFNPATKAQDLADAKKLMEAAGFPNGKGLKLATIWRPNFDVERDMAVNFQGNVKSSFPDAVIDLQAPPDGAAYNRATADRNYDVREGGEAVSPDPRLTLQGTWRTGSSQNYSNYSNPKLDALIDKMFASDGPDADQLIKDAEKVLLDDGYPAITARIVVGTIGFNKRVSGYENRLGIATAGPAYDPFFAMRYLSLG